MRDVGARYCRGVDACCQLASQARLNRYSRAPRRHFARTSLHCCQQRRTADRRSLLLLSKVTAVAQRFARQSARPALHDARAIKVRISNASAARTACDAPRRLPSKSRIKRRQLFRRRRHVVGEPGDKTLDFVGGEKTR